MNSVRYRDFLDLAIRQEIDAAQLYERYAANARPGLRMLLLELAFMEREHEKKLKQFAAGGRVEGAGAKPGVDMKLADYSVEITLSEQSELSDVMIFAMKAEQKAYELYRKLASLEHDISSRQLFEQLAAEEKKHKIDLENQFEQQVMPEN